LKLFSGLADLLSYETFPSHCSHISAYWNFQTNWIRKESMLLLVLQNTHTDCQKAAGIYTPTLIISGEKDLVLGTGQKLLKLYPMENI
jgi:hypothetical protein